MNEPEPNVAEELIADGTVVERINKADLVPISVFPHNHQFVKDKSDQTDEYYAEVCSVEGCHMGRLITK